MQSRYFKFGFVSLLLVISLVTLPSTASADSLVFSFGGHSYQRIDTQLTWTDAKAAAEAMGGYLATITSAAEDTFIYNTLGLANDNWWLGGLRTGVNWNWITGEGTFWIQGTGATAMYSNFYTGEPNGSGEYLQYWPVNTGQWDDTNNTHNGVLNGYVVETNVPEPATLTLFAISLGALGVARRGRRANTGQ